MKKRILSFVLALVMAVSLLPVSVLAAEDAPFTVLTPAGAAVEKTGRTEKVEWTWCEGEEYKNPQTRYAEVDVWTVTVPENTQSLKFKLSDTTKYHSIDTWLPSEDDPRMFVNMDYPEEAIGGSWDSEAQAYQVDKLPACTKGDAPITVWNNDYWNIPTLRIYVKFAPAEDAPFVLKADGQAVAVEKTPITGYELMYDKYLFPIYKATITESTRVLDISDIADTAVSFVLDTMSSTEGTVEAGSTSMDVEKLKSYPVTNTEFTKAVFTLEGGKAITDVIDTTAKKTPFLEFYSESDEGERQIYGLILEIKEDPAPAEDENAPVVAGATLERITGSVYGSATNVYLAKLPADAAQFSVTLQSDEFVRAGSFATAKARKYYVSQAYLDSTDWYNSLDAVMEDRRAYNGYRSVEEMLQYYDGGYSSKEDFLKRGCGCETPAAFWDKTYNFVKCETTPLTMQTDNLAAMRAKFFNELFGSSSVKFDPTVEFRLLEVHTDSTLIKNIQSPGYGKGNPRSVLLLQFGEPTPLDRTALQAAIDAAPKAEDGKYYTSGDRYNGKASDTIVNDKNVGWDGSFWKEYQKVLTRAKEALDTADSQEKLDAAAAALNAAIAKLIPTTQVNATALHEMLHGEWVWQPNGPSDYALRNKKTAILGANINSVEAVSADNTTPGTYAAFLADKAQGEALLAQLYDESGNPTAANTADKQDLVDKLGAATSRLIHVDIYDRALKYFSDHKAEAQALLSLYDPAKLEAEEYTAASWKAYTNAYAALQADLAYSLGTAGTYEDYLMLRGFYGYYADNDAGQWTHYIAHIEALKIARRQLASTVDVEISFTYVNNFGTRYSTDLSRATMAYTNDSLTLTGGKDTLADALTAAGITFDKQDVYLPGSPRNDSDIDPYLAVIVNGESYGIVQLSQLNKTDAATIRLHKDDRVRVARVPAPTERTEASSGLDSTAISEGVATNASAYQGSLSLIDVTAPTEKLQVGDKATITATVTGADPTVLGTAKSAQGITLFISAPQQTETFSQPIYKTAAITGEDGRAQYVFTQPGWYTVAMVNVSKDDPTFTSVYNEVTVGRYPSLYAGGCTMVYVAEAADPAAVLQRCRAENLAKAKAYFDGFHDYDFPAGIYTGEFVKQYQTLVERQNAQTDLTVLMGIFDADFALLQGVGARAYDHAAVIAALRKNMSYLPNDLNELTESNKNTVKAIQAAYAGLNDHQKKLLNSNEIRLLDELAKLDANKLKAVAKVTVEVKVDGSPLPSWSGTGGNAYRGWPCLTWSGTPNPDGSVPTPSWATLPQTSQGATLTNVKAGDLVFIRRYMPNHTDEKYWLVWSADNGQTWELAEEQTLGEYSDYYLARCAIAEDVADGSTVTILIKTISKDEYIQRTGDTLLANRQAAISRLDTLKNTLGDKATAAYNEGVANIRAATSAASIDRLYQAAVVAMRAAANNYGKVQVIVENTTYSEKNGAPWDGTLVETRVDLSADSTMMSCVVDALKTVNATVVGAESNYISSINGLGEFDGNKSAGWMGALNDWFVNEGFGAFTVKNGKLADGDVIRVMFTLNGYGADLGGTWGNSDTTLSALKVTGGKLAPNFVSGEAGGRYDYTLVIDGDSGSIRLSPTAANKNFQVKAFLNEKVTDKTEGRSFFKRTESIPVKVGDTIYVGCGAKGWLSMNNQSGNTQSSDGTWYVLHVVSADTGADYVVGLIDDLPAAVKYENYSATEDAVSAARAAYGILSKAEQAKVSNLAKLEKLEQAIASFRSVDTLKAQISDLPEADKLSVAHSQAVAAAEKMFVALTTEQKDCLTIAEVEKAEAVFAEMKRILEAPIKDAEAKIDAIGEVTLESGEAVLTAQAAFNALTPEQQAQVSNADKLQSAVTKLAALRKAVLTEKLDELYKTTGDFMGTLGTPTVNSTGGEWMVIGLARSGRPVPAGYYDNVVEYVKAKADANERLHPAKVTDNARVILALTAIGKDVTNVGGHNLLKGLDNMDYVQTQGINGPIFTLIALDSHNYPTMGDVTREKLIQVILDAQLTDGGWALSGNDADPDMTAMAIQSLAPYYKANETVKAAVDKALETLSALQRNDGGFDSWGTVNSESCAQVIVALTALGIDPTADSRFVKNGLTVLDALAGFYVTGGGFRHTANGDLDGMPTEQGYYALAAYYRFANAQTRLYDMSDVAIQTGGSNTPATGDTGVLVWVIALPVTILATAFVLKRKEREA